MTKIFETLINLIRILLIVALTIIFILYNLDIITNLIIILLIFSLFIFMTIMDILIHYDDILNDINIENNKGL